MFYSSLATVDLLDGNLHVHPLFIHLHSSLHRYKWLGGFKEGTQFKILQTVVLLFVKRQVKGLDINWSQGIGPKARRLVTSVIMFIHVEHILGITSTSIG